MKSNLKSKTEQWQRMERQTDQQRQQAEQFYKEELMPLIEKEFIRRNREKALEKTEYMILSVGTSFEPLVLDIRLMQPRRIFFLYTKKSEEIIRKVVDYCGLDAMSYGKQEINETNSLDIYRAIKDIYIKWERPSKIYLDITGGTKVMSAAAAMTGTVLNVQLVYVGSEHYLAALRKPEPGLETLNLISNPIEVFGDLEKEKAYALFDRFNYAGARERLEKLREAVPDPQIRQEISFACDLAEAYEHWDALEFPESYGSMRKLTGELRRDMQLNSHFILADFIDDLEEQEAILKNLSRITELIQKKNHTEILRNPQYIVPLMFTMYVNAEIRCRQEKYDMATLLLYRLMEMIEQRRLILYNLYVSRMDYQHIHYDLARQPELKETNEEARLNYFRTRVSDTKTELFKKNGSRPLPEQVSLLEGFIMLHALQDAILPTEERAAQAMLKRIRAMVYLRNNSIFAHGLGAIPKVDFEKFRKFVHELFLEFCKVEGIDFAAYEKKMKWLSPTDSRYYEGVGRGEARW
ncbi:MAG: TIGR02710 family CRISPR-associated CARF protein [Clostridiales bacterium]|nr:TIGR02710 family CRISPR-associated CARF protein [Clostridiales bacterium]